MVGFGLLLGHFEQIAKLKKACVEDFPSTLLPVRIVFTFEKQCLNPHFSLWTYSGHILILSAIVLQGDCTHCMVIRDMRLIHPDDVQNRAAYPLLVHQLKKILKKCTVCRIYKATKVTLDDKLAGENPCYFCDNCYYLLHYSEEGNLLYSSFTVYDYLQDYY